MGDDFPIPSSRSTLPTPGGGTQLTVQIGRALMREMSELGGTSLDKLGETLG